ncbi:hypothetical protein ACHHYP_20799 [Achlya hypogyna]|uniref:Uncharacterized protein n=1 Tax=Achlya hypogyna TaxID=1202772 RepID=A0A1V9Y9F8_ACHHY|nr:hypothetical protein ACHHYP_20799 [Achlya hypogyna]
MKERFYGFRYEIQQSSETAMASIEAHAQQYGCFGWVQPSPQVIRLPAMVATIVGEVRCNASRGPQVHAWMESKWQAHVLAYDSSKIRFHYTYFRRVERERVTCFSSPPHACVGGHDEL